MKIAGIAGAVVAWAILGPAGAQADKPELQLVDFQKLDVNHDGKLSRLEAQADPELSMQFDMLDVNHDGFLSIAEFQAWPRAKRTQAPDPSTAPGGSSGAQHLPKY